VIYFEKALPDLFDRFTKLKVIHVGNKTTWDIPEKYQKKIVSLGKISQDRLCDYYRSVDIIVLCSLSEGIPAVLMEAMAAGCPVITSDIVGADEYISHQESGYIYKTGSVSELKKGITYMLENRDKTKDMAKKAMKKMSKLEQKKYFCELLKFCEDIENKSINLLRHN
jgi:glycosyltransferase involved in cell wall biosynthesis